MASKSYYLSYESATFQYSIERSTRRKKTISILIRPDRVIVVRAPRHVTVKYIEQLVQRKAEWIVGKLKTVNSMPKPLSRNYQGGEQLSYLGKTVKLFVGTSKDNIGNIEYEDGRITVFLPEHTAEESMPSHIKVLLQRWYIAEADKTINRLVAKYSDITGLIPNKVTIKNLKSSWGSCTGRDDLGFNWRLVMAPLPVIEYVVAHELCHIKEKNHSKNFWSLLGRYIPDCKDARNQLKLFGHTYEL